MHLHLPALLPLLRDPEWVSPTARRTPHVERAFGGAARRTEAAPDPSALGGSLPVTHVAAFPHPG